MNIDIQLTESELQELAKLVDAGIRSTGLQGVPIANMFLQKIEQARNYKDKDKSQ